MFHAAALDEGQGLERFGAGAQKGDRLRVAVGGQKRAVRVHHGDGAVVDRFHDTAARQFEQRQGGSHD